MDARLITVAIPVFFALIFAERLWMDLLRRRAASGTEPVYRLHDSIADLSCGMGQQTLGLFLFVIELSAYAYLYQHLAPYKWSPRSPLAWVVLVLLIDLSYYWFHRASHRVNALWAIHVVHHQSEEYNFSVALRQGWLEPLAQVPFLAPIALLGFPPEMFLTVYTLHTLWQFWPHTRGVGKLAIDRWLNSPSNHRVHHAANPAYIDKNYSGGLLVWDRVFGTFTPEAEEPAYGTVKPLASFNPLWANLAGWVEMARLARRCPRFIDKLSVPFRPPEWRPRELGGDVVIPAIDRTTQRRYEVQTPRAVNAYAIGMFVVITAGSASMAKLELVPWSARVVAAVLMILSLSTLAGLTEGKRWARPMEALRLVAMMPAAYLIFRGTALETVAVLGAAGLALLQGIWLLVIGARARAAVTA